MRTAISAPIPIEFILEHLLLAVRLFFEIIYGFEFRLQSGLVNTQY